ncbi:activator of HSP90 ATPase [Parapedobacter pyrenivorans]|uniref:Activator of HSP90 ATPase n=1 Tax=Parapedobacter pyrenivorans TaxID=1305674 RepID=A0A917HHU4_9SPHI|nr:SRPBCC domain-containing protein [Parapedobacter pyrenivorans]GGG79336.1 activator of HSP90 ATPase [Parapedobacter pyrenivorans]
MSTTKKELLITHLFDAPREIVFRAWTDPEKLKVWYAPDGCTIEYRHIEVSPGGSFHSCVHDPIYGDCWITGKYLEVSAPDKLVFTMVLSNELGNDVASADAGKPEDWPERLITTVTFEPIKQQTKVTIHQTVLEEEAKKTGAYQSWLKMFNKLSQLLIRSN